MRYHLGEFRPAPDLIGPVLRAIGNVEGPSPTNALLPRLVRILAQWDHSPESVLEELLGGSSAAGEGFFGGGPRRMQLELHEELEELRRAPDLLGEAGLCEVDRAWTLELYEELARCGPRRAGLRLVECARYEGPEGYVAIAGMNHQAAHDLRPGDTIHAGFVAIRRSGGPLRIRPRVHRAASANALVVQDVTGSDELESEGGIGPAVAHCLSAAVAEKHARRLRAAGRTPVPDRERLLDELLPDELQGRAAAEWRRGGDPSLFGALDAVASLARAERDFARRFELESLAGRMLDRATLYPARSAPRTSQTPGGPHIHLGV